MPSEFDVEQLKQIDRAWQQRLDKALAGLNDARKVLLDLYPRDRIDSKDCQREVQALRAALADGVKPADYVRGKLSWLFGDFILQEHEATALNAVTRLTELPYSINGQRRSFRCGNAQAYTQRIRAMLRSFCTDTTLAYPLTALLAGEVPMLEWAFGLAWRSGATLPFRIAAALDAQDAKVEALVRDVLLGDGAQSVIRPAIRGVLFSRREDLYPLVGKLLVAARLQEGLRQAICETADDGQLGALRCLIGVIAENDLIRFSGVKRAVGCWLGLMTDETRDLERISGKSLELVQRCLADPAFLAECLKSEDAMAVYIALWAMGVQDVSAAAQMVLRLAKDGSRHQALVAGVFLNKLDMPEVQERVCVAVCLERPEDLDIQAVYLRQLEQIVWHAMARPQENPAELKKLPDIARRFCEHLLALRKKAGKGVTFSPCVFPWNTEVLSKANMALAAFYAAYCAEDDALLDACAPLLAECDTDIRYNVLRCCYGTPRTTKQRELVLRCLCDKSEDTRRETLTIVRGWSLKDADYAIIVELLRYKYGDVRPALMDLLMRQKDDALFATVQTLLGDKNEERRMAGLGIVKELTEDNTRPALVKRCAALISCMEDLSDKARMVLKGIDREQEKLYGPEDVYVPHLEVTPVLMEAAACFQRYFPDGSLAAELNGSMVQKLKACLTRKTALAQTEEDFASLIALYRKNLLTPVPERNDALLNSLNMQDFHSEKLPLHFLWEGWYKETLQGDPGRLLRMLIRLPARKEHAFRSAIERIYGKGWADPIKAIAIVSDATSPVLFFASGMGPNLAAILHTLAQSAVSPEDLTKINLALLCWIALRVEAKDLFVVEADRWRRVIGLMEHPQVSTPTREVPRITGELLQLENNARWIITLKGQQVLPELLKQQDRAIYTEKYAYRQGYLIAEKLLHAVCEGMLPVRSFYAWQMEVAQPDEVRTLLAISCYYRTGGRANANHRSWRSSLSSQKYIVERFLGHEYADTPGDRALLARVDEIAQPLLRAIVDAETHRSDAATLYSPFVPYVARLEGAETFTALLAAMGKDKLVRHAMYGSCDSRAESLSHLLSTCVPLETDTPERLRALIRERKLPQSRLIEAALFCPEWLSLLEETLEISGLTCAAYYFVAHMKEDSDPVREAWIARYSPLTHEELSAGAFDIAWFRRAYAAVGEAVFDQLYAAAKYIGSGGRHARARKYADAALGRVTLEELATHIGDKRNQDSLMAYPLVPLQDDADLRARYLFIQDFLKGSRKFGAQRIASEKAAASAALTNLAANAGYADAMRLTLRMEAGLIDDLRPLMEEKAVGDVTVRLVIGRDGLADLHIEKAGKPLKAVPAKIKKDPHILALTEARKQLREQQRRARAMLETAMEDETAFTAAEISALMASEVLSPLLRRVVFLHGESFGLFDGQQLETADGTTLQIGGEETLTIAHPYHLLACDQWLPWQKRLYDSRTVQPFRQVFRELYVRTKEEEKADASQRYAGHQIQPGKASACLKGRRWVTDPECGLQRVDYRRNIVAVMVAMGDWFTPADIEAPTLEAVLFFDRLTGRRMRLNEVPPVMFSEIMRDMDLAVSVAHAGGVDPEASHSTIEMRAALLSLALPLFRLTNVEVRDRHAIITGKLAQYTVHLGSGVAHQVGGTMLNILPVHSAHRGRIFLPFADDDPQTAEVLSKVLLLAEDGKIKDPTILEQIRPVD